MASKPKKQAGPVMDDIKARRAHQIEARTPEDARRTIATDLASPELAAVRAMQAIEGGKGLGEHWDTSGLIKCLRVQAAAVNRGDLSKAEAMLMNQATTLQSLFARLTERVMGNDTIPALRRTCGWHYGRNRNAGQRWKLWRRSRTRRLSMPGRPT